jgi:hypothetical protein
MADAPRRFNLFNRKNKDQDDVPVKPAAKVGWWQRAINRLKGKP